MPENIRIPNLGGTIADFPKTPIVPDIPSRMPGGGAPGSNMSIDDLFAKGLASTPKFKGKEDIPASSFYVGERYPESRPFTDVEEMAAQQQSAWAKWGNGITKMAGVAATSTISGTAGLIYGIGSAIKNQRFASLIDNDVTRSMDNSMNNLEDILPNYYSEAENNAEWYSGNNLLTANFWSDKLVKNLGYALGALGGGVAWAKAFKLIGLTNYLVKTGQGLQASVAAETAMSAVPRLQKLSAFESALTNFKGSTKAFIGQGLENNSERILTSVMGTFGEASIEGLQNMNSFRDKAIEEFKQTYGRLPTGDELDEINLYADKIGNYTWGMNTLLLSFTNYIQLPKILGSTRKGEKMLINDIEQTAIGGEFTKFVPKTKFGRLAAKARGVGAYLFAPEEAFEEGMQFAIQTGTTNFFNRAYENKEELGSFLDTMNGVMDNVFDKGIEETLGSKEGMESILIGGISGGIQQSIRTYKKQGLLGTGGERGRNTEIALAALNQTNINDVLKDQAKFIAIGIGSQKLRQSAIASGDILSEKDYEKDYALSYIMPRVKYGKTDGIYNELSYYESQAMTEDGFSELQNTGVASMNEKKEQFLQRVASIKETTKYVDELYSSINDKYSGVTTDDGKRKYSPAVIDRMVYAAAKVADYNNRIPGLTNSLVNAGVDTQSVLSGIIENKEPSVEATKNALDYINKLDVLSEAKDNLKRNLQDVIELSLRRKLFIDDYDGIKNNPKEYEDVDKVIETKEPIIVSQTEVSEKTGRKKTVEKELDLGREYSLKQFVNVQGGKLQVAPKLTVLSKTLGGEYEVRLPDGTETFLKPEEFKQYQVSETEVDPKKIKQIVDDAIDAVLAKKKYKDVPKPTGDKVAHVNSLNNPSVLADVEKEVAERSEKLFEEIKKEEELSKQEDLKKALDETSDLGVQTKSTADGGTYEPDAKKTDQEVVDGTTPPVEGYSQTEPLAEHHVRANRFGANYYTFANKDNFRGVIVTQGNEASVGLPGLTQWLKDKGKKDAPVDPTKTIALVVMGIDPITGERYFVGVNGERLEKPTLENTIYQVFPETLEWSSGDSMFRESTPDDVKKAFTENYKKWRESTLKNPTADLYKIKASFGTPQYVGELDEYGNFKFDYTARVPVEASGLITDVDLRTKRVIGVPTTDGAVVYGSSTFNDAKGIPLLYTNNGLVRLNNRNISEKEAVVIYDAIVKLAENLFKDGNLKSNESSMLYNWLKSVIYWGTPKDTEGNRKPAGYSSVFFENMNLIMGKEEKKFSLKPSELKANKAAIIEELQKMYNNVNSTLVTGGQKKDWNKPYTEITAITPEGVQTREWKNYQTFLLSSKNPDGSARNAKTIPLTTRIRPLKDAEDTNRKGIYFTVLDKKSTASKEATPTTPEKKVVAKPTTPEGAKKEKVVGRFDFGKDVENVLSSKLGDIPFVIDIDKFKETDGKKGISLPDPATDPAYKATLDGAIVKLSKMPGSGITEETSDEDAASITENFFRNLIKKEVNKELAPAPTAAPLSDIEKVVITDENYNNWSNVRDRSDYQAFVDQVKSTLAMFDQVPDKSKITPETVEQMLSTVKAFSNKAIRDRVVPLIVAKYKTSTAAVLQPNVSPLAQAQGTARTEPVVTATEAAKADVVQTYEYKGKTQTVRKQTSKKDGITKVTFIGERSDKPGRTSRGGYVYGGPTSNSVQQFFDDYKITVEDITEDLSINNIKAVKVLEERTSEGKTAITFTLTYSEEMGGMSSEPMEMAVKKQKFTSDAELAALEGAKPAEAPVTPSVPSKSLQQKINERKRAGSTKRGSKYRMMLAQDMKKFKPENWVKVEAFLKNAFPNIPVYRVKNYITAANGRRAHGMFENGAIYLSQSGQVGTIYHEVFHAIWQALTDPSERANINNEFRSRSGVFFDRVNLKNVKYSEATDKQIEEKLAEELREYIQDGKAPQKPAQGKKSWIATLFYDLLNFFKTFFTGENAKSNTEKLFEKIGSGYYKRYNPYDSSLSFAKVGFIDIEDAIGGELADYSLDIFTGEQLHDIMQHMTYTTIKDLFEENESLFTIGTEKENVSGIFKKLEDELGDVIADNIAEIEKMIDDGEISKEEGDVEIKRNHSLYKNIMNEWDNITEKFKEYIKSYSIDFDENDEIELNSDEKSKNDPFGDARKIDSMRKANSAIKILLASLPVVDSEGVERLSSIGGYTLYPMSEIFMGVMNNVHNSRNPTEMLERIKAMADDDPKYKRLYERLSKGSQNIDDLNDEHDLQLLSAFWRTFKKQSPDVKTVYILDNGDIQVGDANFTTAARQVKEEFVNNIKEAISKGSKYFKKAENGKSYIGNAEAIEGDVKLSKDNLAAQVAFLKEIGIDFDLERLSLIPEKTEFAEAVNGIRTSIANSKSIMSVGGRSLDIEKRLRNLSEIKAKMDNPEFSSTYYNVNGELTQTFIGVNAASDLYDALSQVKNLSELIGTQYEYLLTDSFTKNSLLLYKMFDRDSGVRIEGTENLLKPAYADGVVDEKKGRQIESSKLNQKQRLVQNINLNREGYFLSLVPGDASIGWSNYMGEFVNKSEILTDYSAVHKIFRGYLEDEIALAKDKTRPVDESKKADKLRFFSSILEKNPKLQDDILAEENIDDVYEKYGDDINSAIDEFINARRDRLKNSLIEYGSVIIDEGKYKTKELSFGKEAMTEEELNTELAALSINFMISNIEFHKILYSDPYQYSDELKRTKIFQSPRQSIVNGSSEMNTAYNKVWNKAFDENDIGYTNFDKDYFETVTIEDVSATSILKDYGTFKETDGGGFIIFKALRNFKIRAGEWDADQERQYKYEIAWEKRDKKKKLTNSDKRALKEGNPNVRRTFTPIKPSVSGNKANGRPYNDVVIDKFALYPLSYRIMKEINPTSNVIKLYDKMQKENIDYAVFKSGRKVGAEKVFPLYKDGKFNEDPFVSEEEKEDIMSPQTVINIPFSIIAIQSEVPSKEDDAITRGSQLTKLATIDFMEAGVPIDFKPELEDNFDERYIAWNTLSEEKKRETSNLYAEIKNNEEILEALVEEGVNELLTEFGITKTPEGYKIDSIEKVANALKREITKREINDNISAALKGYKSGAVFLEATPAYQQIRNILYSIADRAVLSQKINGSMKVQIPSTLLESGDRIVAKNGALTSDVLNFYEKDGERVIEIMVARWFDSDMSDEELIKYLNTTDEGKEILKGIDFRIPTQKQNSVDVFKIKKFLPREFGDSVVVPSAIVKKSGSDFDIDKLNIYFKNVDTSGPRPRLIPFQGTSEEVRSRFKYRKDFKKSLENGYIDSLQKLISHPLNFDNLVKPNSAEDLKKISVDVVNKLGLGTFDYNNPGNMLDMIFMTRLRHAFVTGKYAIGIAAVNQTNHSLNQRQLIYIDIGRANLSQQDKEWIRKGNILFKEYNKVTIDGVTYPTISKIKDKTKKYISDVLSQMIDGYVDITKDPWIIELGITPNVASTWMFLVKVGVPIETIGYFMNQPIIREYLRELEKTGSTWLFNKKLVKRVEQRYWGGANIQITEIPSNEDLFDTIGKKQLSAVEKTEQRFMLHEFLKYAKMGEQMFYITQGTNFDTSTFNDPFLIFKKLKMLDKARNTIFFSKDEELKNTIPAVDAILKNSFLQKMMFGAIESRDAIAEILKMDKGPVRLLLQDILTPYVTQKDRDFIRISQRAVTTLIDWAVQTEKNLNGKIEEFLVSKDKNVAKRVMNFLSTIKDDPILSNNAVVKILRPNFADPLKEGEVNNLYLKNKSNKVYDQNQIIYGFKELKNYLKNQGDEQLYNDLVTLSILQSGLTQSTVSFTSLLPYDDVMAVYNDVIGNLSVMSNLQAFKKLNVFERTFWNYDDIVPHMEAQYKIDWQSGFPTYNENMKFRTDIYDAMKQKDIPILLRISEKSKEANYDVIVYTYEREIPAAKKREMRKAGDYSFIKKGLFKRVGYVKGNYIYKAINAWGDGIYAKEFYNTPEKSKIDNGFISSDETITDAKIMFYFGVDEVGPVLEEDLPSEGEVVEQELTPTPIPTPVPTAPAIEVKKTTEEKPVEKNNYTQETKDAISKFNLEESEYKVVEINGVQQVIATTNIPKKINKNSNKFYTTSKSAVIFERYGKKIVVPGFEDINLMIEQGTKSVFELSTGMSVSNNGKSEKTIIESLKEIFETKNIRDILAKSKKTNINNDVIYKSSLISFEKAFSPERQTEILANFAAKHKVTQEVALENIKKGIVEKGQEAIDKLNECY